jgi:hypothetical protein
MFIVHTGRCPMTYFVGGNSHDVEKITEKRAT